MSLRTAIAAAKAKSAATKALHEEVPPHSATTTLVNDCCAPPQPASTTAALAGAVMEVPCVAGSSSSSTTTATSPQPLQPPGGPHGQAEPQTSTMVVDDAAVGATQATSTTQDEVGIVGTLPSSVLLKATVDEAPVVDRRQLRPVVGDGNTSVVVDDPASGGCSAPPSPVRCVDRMLNKSLREEGSCVVDPNFVSGSRVEGEPPRKASRLSEFAAKMREGKLSFSK